MSGARGNAEKDRQLPDKSRPLRRRSSARERRFETTGMAEEALPRIEPSPDVDEARGFDPGNVPLRN